MTTKGYIRVRLSLPGEMHGVMAHRIVCIAAHGLPTAPFFMVNHKNGVKNDNRGANLEWATNQENLRHAGSLGLLGTTRGEKCHTAKLTNRQARRIRAWYAEAIKGRKRAPRGSMRALAAKYGLSDHALWRVAVGKSYR